MKTIVKIPFERAPEDPSWIIKRKSGKVLTSDESQEYYKFEFEKELKEM